MRAVVIVGIVISSLFGILTPVAPFAGPPLALAQSCNARRNPQETAMSFIGRCCKGSILRVFPSHLLSTRLEDIRKGKTYDYKKAWKLLNDNRFKK
ncbi:hypothetical protein WMF20_38145 [Sorangium sp. So ce834]|uniref:hypothetical protein n=1 Tax=Sorangium sp. So ce834 TaxID=3133321 RepID=UPI003F6306A2